jgi:hypothetical protein
MLKSVLATALGGLFLTTTLALADDSESATCLRNKVWEGYSEGWGIRTMTTTTVGMGKTKNYLVTLYKGNEYQFLTCADQHAANLDVLLYDSTGSVVMRDSTADREPSLTFKPNATATYYVVLYLRETVSRASSADTSLAIVYR